MKRIEFNKIISNNKPLQNCIVETNEEYSYFKFIKVDEEIRWKGFLGIFNGYEIHSESFLYYDSNFKTIDIFGCMKEYDNDIVKCNKEVIKALEESGCKIEIKENYNIVEGDRLFESLGFSEEESEIMRLKSQLYAEILKDIRKKKLKNRDVAQLWDTNESKVSEVINGKLDKFSIEKLIEYVQKLNNKIRIVVVKDE